MTDDTGVMATGGLRGITEDTPEQNDQDPDQHIDGISGARDGTPSTERYNDLHHPASGSDETPDPAEAVANDEREREAATRQGLVTGPRGGVTGTSES